jgi:hypothetical protein
MAVDISTQQMALTRDTGPGGFMERVTAVLAFVCPTILSEPGTTPYHQSRAFYAQQVVARPQQAATQAGPQVVMGVNVVNATTYDETTQTATCTIADIDLQSQILTLWNSLAGIDTPS